MEKFLLKSKTDEGEDELKDKFHLVGTKMPEFSLPNSRGETKSIKDFLGKNVVVILLRGII